MLSAPGRRVLLGIAGEPGAGKSTLAADLCQALPTGTAVVVPLDGFHLSAAVLRQRGTSDRKGAPDTFDVAGYRMLLRRLRDGVDDVVYAPAYVRELEEPIAAAVPIPSDIPVVVTEGNYLLADDPQWSSARRLLDEVWYLDLDRTVRQARLIQRHVQFGKAPQAAEAWTRGSDERNAAYIRTSRHNADLVITTRA